MKVKANTAISGWVRSNVLGLVAIFIALSGTAYATHPGGANTISTDDIINGEVREPDILNGAVTGADINNTNGVRSEDVRDDTLAGGGLSAADLGPDSVAASEVTDESLGSAELAPNSVASSEVGPDAIGSGEVAPDSLAAADLAPDSVASSEVAANAIGSGEIIDFQVGNSDLGANSVDGAKVAFGSLRGTDVAQESLSGNDILNGTISSSDIGTGAVGSSEVANASLGTAEFASSIPAVRVTRTTSQGIADDTLTNLNFNSERYDTAGMHSNTSNISRLTAPVTGIYEVTASLTWLSQVGFATGERRFVLRKNGTTEVGFDKRDADTSGNGGVTVNFTTMLRLVAGDFVEAQVYQDSGDTRSVRKLAEHSPEFAMTWLAPGP
jgi:hypothetical protein